MLLLRGSVAALSRRAAADTIVPHLTDQFKVEFRQSPSLPEVRSWACSIPILLDQLMDAGLGKVEVLLEYQLPLYSGRADAVLVGQHPDGGPSCVVVENKQWTRLRSVDIKHRLVAVQGLNREMLHPQEQVRGYWSTCRISTVTWAVIPGRWRAAPTCTTPPQARSRTCVIRIWRTWVLFPFSLPTRWPHSGLSSPRAWPL